ncbi:hypothetical protein [Actinacidiphila rubida]|uniref:Uncharacterized protein n=1 Tax=Actinacidiphila rubida TaxID=310780 RepID=A0A1H8R9G6_9ACTN|nr:hypothetical protein [Actinacidiphila rubida]SEO62788.1 hypothetical protein SAMN05216267_103354 [Actinacidiphila rubida]
MAQDPVYDELMRLRGDDLVRRIDRIGDEAIATLLSTVTAEEASALIHRASAAGRTMDARRQPDGAAVGADRYRAGNT